jgi:hypothetical protein
MFGTMLLTTTETAYDSSYLPPTMLGITTKDSLWVQQLSELTDVVMLLTTTEDSFCEEQLTTVVILFCEEQLTTVVILLVSPKIFDELPGLLAQRVIPKLF